MGADDVPTPSRLGLLPVAQLLAKTFPPIEWSVEGYIERGDLAAIVGVPGGGKTFLAIYWLVQAAMRGERVALIEEEGGERGLQRRLSRALAAVGGIAAVHAVGGDVLYAFKKRVSLMNALDIVALESELAGCSMAVFDSFARMTPGLEENSSAEMGRVVDALDRVRTATKATVLVIHHTGKLSWKGGVASIGDGRGSSALPGGLDAIVALMPVPPAERQQGYVCGIVAATKTRENEPQKPMRFSCQMTGPAAYVEMVEVEGPTLEQQEGLEREVLRYLRRQDGPVPKSQIESDVDGSTPRIRAAVDALVASGVAVTVPHGRWTRIALAPTRPDSPGGDSPDSPPYVVRGEADGRQADGGGRNGRASNWQDTEVDP